MSLRSHDSIGGGGIPVPHLSVRTLTEAEPRRLLQATAAHRQDSGSPGSSGWTWATSSSPVVCRACGYDSGPRSPRTAGPAMSSCWMRWCRGSGGSGSTRDSAASGSISIPRFSAPTPGGGSPSAAPGSSRRLADHCRVRLAPPFPRASPHRGDERLSGLPRSSPRSEVREACEPADHGRLHTRMR